MYFDLANKGIYPPGPDQEEYLASGVAATEKGVFFWKAPLYSAWMGAFYLIGGKDLRICFFLEKTVSVLLLASLTGYLVVKLFDKRTGILAAIWVLNCRYLLQEPNNSHTLTACLLVASAIILLTMNEVIRIPASLLFIFFSTLVRSEMWLPLIGILICLAVSGRQVLFGGRLAELYLRRQMLISWIFCCAIGLLLSILFSFRQGGEERYGLIDEAFAQNFAANYVERRHLLSQYPHPWGAAHEITNLAMPGVKTLIDAVTLYPSEVLAHILFNVKVSIKAVPSMLAGVESFWIMTITIVIYISSYLIANGSYPTGWKTLASDNRRLLVIWGLSCLLLILNSYIFRVAARYYIQLIPAFLIIVMFLLRALILQAVNRVKA